MIGYIGTIGMAHGLENVLYAAARIPHSNVRFLLVGPGAEREKLIAKSTELGLRNVIFAPPLPKEQISVAWSLCNIALVHLRDTALFRTVIPSKIFEAMAMGLPLLLACPEGEATEIVKREGCGISIAPENPEELAAAALWLVENPLKVQDFAIKSRRAAAEYSRERQACGTISSLETAIGIHVTDVTPSVHVRMPGIDLATKGNKGQRIQQDD